VSEAVRLIELLGTLSLASDAADGFPPETTMRQAVLAGALARRVGDDELVGDAVVGGLLRHIGCTGFATEEAHVYGAGDDISLRRLMATVDPGQPERAMELITTQLARHAPPDQRRRALDAMLGGGPEAVALHHQAQCEAGERLGSLLPVRSGARAVLSDAFERWDGLGGPAGKAGDEVALVARVVEVACVAELFRARQGRGGARAELRMRSGGHLDPVLVAAFLDGSEDLFDLVMDDHHAVWDALLDAEPPPWTSITPLQVEAVALAFARFSDLKSTFFAGHSEGVAALASMTATVAGLDPDTVTAVRHAALLHDLGRVSVATGTWDLPRPLRRPEVDRVHFHSWETFRMLAATPLLAELAPIAGAAHERTDGSGYHRGLVGEGVLPAARLLAAADVACALAEPRPHRGAMDGNTIHGELRAEVAAGRLDRDAVAAVLAVGGGAPAMRPTWPSGLSDSEVEVLRLVATGATNKDVARDLGITAKTVAHHVAHIYDKTGCRSRAGTTLFAIERGLIGPRAAR
jgi:HD-GYP domain-containing protein (c-di-GMP phosphodiesterase class II)/DNA-binding CsgD family transcriptional regulator